MATTRGRTENEYACLFWSSRLCRSRTDHRARNNSGRRIRSLWSRLSGGRRHHERWRQCSRVEHGSHSMVFGCCGSMCRSRRDVRRRLCDRALDSRSIRSCVRSLATSTSALSPCWTLIRCTGLRLLCDSEHQTEAEYQVTRAIAARLLVLSKIRAEKVEETDTSIVQAVLESPTRDPNVLKALVEDLRAFPWIRSVEWTETAEEIE